MSIVVLVIVLSLLGFGLIWALNKKAMDIDCWQEMDRGDGKKFKDWR